ncbi:IS66 family insertion sequence element accessory protein TnpA [Bradyrhizobium diazoefficiens]|uniref:IS66 family insertion sequence element accessory protein TnpA n=1 Tax=Bradyrhizobium diazoefficiens TaxID=1355477 RepID=UPI003D9B3B3C
MSFHFGFSAALEILRCPKHFQNKAQRGWSLHVDTWRRSGLGIRKYCCEQRLAENTFCRWLKQLAGEDTARNSRKIRRNFAARSAGKNQQERCESKSSNGFRSARTSATARHRRSGRCMWRR